MFRLAADVPGEGEDGASGSAESPEPQAARAASAQGRERGPDQRRVVVTGAHSISPRNPRVRTDFILLALVDPYLRRNSFKGTTALAIAWWPPADPMSPSTAFTTVPAAFW